MGRDCRHLDRGGTLLNLAPEQSLSAGITATDSMVERFGLFTIIVLGEVVVGIVGGLSQVDRDSLTVATGILGLSSGFAFWWTGFDFVGRRLPREGRVGARIGITVGVSTHT